MPRLYVYHADNIGQPVLNRTFKIMERRLMLYIMDPAMIASFVFGMDDSTSARLFRRELDAGKDISFSCNDRVPRGIG